MGGASSSSSTNASSFSKARSANVAGLRKDFDKMFADMEFRCKRAAIMNYHEAERYDSRADLLHKASSVIGALGVSGIWASIAKTKKVTANPAGVAGMLALPVSGILQFLSNGSSSLAPTVAEKAKLHVKAGAGWQKIARMTRSYRVQLKHLDEGEITSLLLSTWYREIVEASEEVSKILPIHADTYAKYDEPDAVASRFDKREGHLKKYMGFTAEQEVFRT